MNCIFEFERFTTKYIYNMYILVANFLISVLTFFILEIYIKLEEVIFSEVSNTELYYDLIFLNFSVLQTYCTKKG